MDADPGCAPEPEPVAEPAPGPGPCCARCGTSAAGADLHWTRQRDDDGSVTLLCPGCTRRHLRDIEAKLASDWW